MPLSTYVTLKAGIILSKVLEISVSNWFITFIFSVLAFFAPIYTIILLVFLAVATDLISGLCKAWKLKHKITSFKLRDTVIKLLLYCLLIALVYGIQITCFWGLPIVNIVAGFILFAEAVSISENIDTISNGKLGIANLIKKIRSKWLVKVDEELENK